MLAEDYRKYKQSAVKDATASLLGKIESGIKAAMANGLPDVINISVAGSAPQESIDAAVAVARSWGWNAEYRVTGPPYDIDHTIVLSLPLEPGK